MSDSAPNFRVYVRHEEDTEPVRTTLREVLADNEGAELVCEAVKSLQPGGEVRLSGGWIYTRPVVSPPRYTRVRVPIRFDGAEYATITIDRKRLTLSIRPARRRSVFELELDDFAQRMLERQAKLNVRAKLKARKARRAGR